MSRAERGKSWVPMLLHRHRAGRLAAGPRASALHHAAQTTVSSFPKDRPSTLNKGSVDPLCIHRKKDLKTQDGRETNGKQVARRAGGAWPPPCARAACQNLRGSHSQRPQGAFTA